MTNWSSDVSNTYYVKNRPEKLLAWARRQAEFTNSDVMEAHRMRADNAAKALSRLVTKGQLERVRIGVYRVAT